MAPNGNVVVIGGGVIGLTNAIFLREAGHQVLVIAAHLPGDASVEYTSPWAGAHWRTHASPDEPMLCGWDVQTYDYWVERLAEEAKDEGLPRAGLKMCESFMYWDGKVTEELWWAPHVQGFRTLSTASEPIRSVNQQAAEMDAPQVEYGAAFRAITINVPRYLVYLQDRALALGVKIRKAALPTHSGLGNALEVAEALAVECGMARVDCFVNSTGIGARQLCGDEKVFPFRGQTVLVKGEASAVRTRIGDGYMAYCIPRPGSGTTILGGTKEKGNWSGTVDAQTTETILERCGQIVPELRTGEDGEFEVISVQCGLRPGRESGPRMEREAVGGRRVVHAYGHAGAGYQNSIGSARVTVRMVDDTMAGRSARL